MEFDVVVEVPRGSRNKYEMDPRTGEIRLDRELFTATHYPVDYGFIKSTRADDGDALDALVVLDEPSFPGCVIRCRALGLFLMSDEKGPDAKILAIPAWDARRGWRELADVPEMLRREIQHFFEIYKDLDPDRHSRVEGWEDRAAAEAAIAQARAQHGGLTKPPPA